MRRTLCLAAFLVPAVATNAFAVCPQSRFSVGPTLQFSTLPVDSRTSSSGLSGAGYNIPAGTLGVHSNCSSLPECGGGAGLYVEDDFIVSGLPGGTNVPLTVHFVVNLDFYSGGIGQGQTSSAKIQDTSGHVASANGPKTNFDLTLAVQAVAGQPLRLHFEMSCSNTGPLATQANGTFSFTGLPAGAGISSCNGYTNGTPVATRASSWGRVKILYR